MMRGVLGLYTLDPFAEGVLVVCLGPATRLAAYVQRQPKRYLAEVTLGAISTVVGLLLLLVALVG